MEQKLNVSFGCKDRRKGKAEQKQKVCFEGNNGWKWKTNKTNMTDDGADTIGISTNGMMLSREGRDMNQEQHLLSGQFQMEN